MTYKTINTVGTGYMALLLSMNFYKKQSYFMILFRIVSFQYLMIQEDC